MTTTTLFEILGPVGWIIAAFMFISGAYLFYVIGSIVYESWEDIISAFILLKQDYKRWNESRRIYTKNARVNFLHSNFLFMIFGLIIFIFGFFVPLQPTNINSQFATTINNLYSTPILGWMVSQSVIYWCSGAILIVNFAIFRFSDHGLVVN